ncbi:MAG: FKBP-type peptidyl-prolyl cis-trans isomerase [Paludibacteraceae bacterium]|nr:FKBP-type peptidyl-prolyl cis-trans isomerase [Paludibacteraceae bacterium]
MSAKSTKKTQPVAVEPKSLLEAATAADSASIAMGLLNGKQFAEWLKTFPGEIVSDKFVDAFTLAFKNRAWELFDEQTAQAYVEQYAQAAQEQMKQKQIAEGEEFLAQNAKRPEVRTTESGLQYEVLIPADGPKPTASNKVKVHYEGRLIDGKVFDSSYQRGEPIEFELGRVIAGWTEGLQLMPVGSKYRLYIPYQLGYGERGAGADIKPYATLIFDVELLDFK